MKSQPQTINLKIDGMHCVACALAIDLELEDLPGVKLATTSYAKCQTQVEFDPGRVSATDLQATIAKTGYRATVLQSSSA